MRERAPPRLDQGVGELQFGERQDSAQDSRGDQVIDLGVHVLDAPRPPTRPESSLRASPPTGFDEHDHTVHGRERFSNAPRQDPSRKVVDHRVQIGAGPVEQADDGGVDVPHLVGARRRRPTVGFAGCTRSRVRRQPFCRTRRYQVEGEAQTVPSRCARMASVPVGTSRYWGAVTMSSIVRTSDGVSR